MDRINVPFLDLVTPHVEMEEQLVSIFRNALHTAGFIGGETGSGVRADLRKLLRDRPLCRCRQRDRRPPLCADGGRCDAGRECSDCCEYLHRYY